MTSTHSQNQSQIQIQNQEVQLKAQRFDEFDHNFSTSITQSQHSYTSLHELELANLEIEAELLHAHKHPEYHERVKELAQVKESRIEQARGRYIHLTISLNRQFEACLKLAQDTKNSTKQGIKKQFISLITDERFEMPKIEFELKKNRPIRASHLSTSWTRDLIAKRRKQGYKNIYVPDTCSGLSRIEISEDIEFMNKCLN